MDTFFNVKNRDASFAAIVTYSWQFFVLWLRAHRSISYGNLDKVHWRVWRGEDSFRDIRLNKAQCVRSEIRGIASASHDVCSCIRFTREIKRTGSEAGEDFD